MQILNAKIRSGLTWSKMILGIAVAGLAGSTALAASVKELQTHQLAGIPGKEGKMLLVEYLPGDSDPIHRHDASAFVYVVEGTIIMQVKGSKPVVVHKGETFFEGPNDIHLIGRNASKTAKAKFVVVLVKNSGAPIFKPAH